MKFSDIVNLNVQDLRVRVSKLRKELFDSSMKLKMKRLANPLVIRLLRRDIARLQTAITAQVNKNKGVEDGK